MRFLLKVITISIVLFLCSCKSIQNNQKISKYTELNTTIVKNLMKEYSIDIPKNWYSYLEKHNDLAYAPKELYLNSRKDPEAFLMIFKENLKRCNCNNVTSLTNHFVEKVSKVYENFNYDIVKGQHPIYGRYNFIIYKINRKSKNYTVLNALILKDSNYYRITYSSSNKTYKKYADDVVKIIHSFKIKE